MNQKWYHVTINGCSLCEFPALMRVAGVKTCEFASKRSAAAATKALRVVQYFAPRTLAVVDGTCPVAGGGDHG